MSFHASSRVKFLPVGLLALAVLIGFSGVTFQAQEPPQEIRVPDPQRGYLSIQKAVDDITEGGTILVAPGIYDENLVIRKSLTLQGEGPEEVRVIGGEEGHPVILIESEGEIEVAIGNLTVAEAKGNRCAVTGPPALCPIGIEARGKANVSMKNVHVSNNNNAPLVEDAGLVVRDSTTMSLTDSTVSGNGGGGFFVTDSATVNFINSTVSDNRRDGLIVRNLAQATLTNSTVSGNGGDGIFMQHSAQGTLINSTVSDNGNNGLFERNSATVSLTSSQIEGNGGDGILLLEEAVMEIQDNRIINNQGYGVRAHWMGCVDNYNRDFKFVGQVTGGGNTIPDTDESDGNQEGDVCPDFLSFLKQLQEDEE